MGVGDDAVTICPFGRDYSFTPSGLYRPDGSLKPDRPLMEQVGMLYLPEERICFSRRVINNEED